MANLWLNEDIKTKKEPHNQGALELDNAVLELDNGLLELDNCSCWPTKPSKRFMEVIWPFSHQMRSFEQKVTK